MRLRKTVALVGMMGAGKSAIGSAVARELRVPFLDSDAEIERAANRTIAEIFERDGEPFFRERETQVIRRLLRTQRCILSTGGGAFMSERNRRIIHDAGVSVWLKVDLDLLWTRVRHKDTRPLLRTADPTPRSRRFTRRAFRPTRWPSFMWRRGPPIPSRRWRPR
jgi:shikimate kinase